MPIPAAFGFSTVPVLHCAVGGASAIATHLSARFGKARRVLIVTDGDLQAGGVTDAARCSLEQAGIPVSVYSGVIASPPEAVLRHAVDFARDHRPDIVLGIGGGSALDIAKLVALMAPSGQSFTQLKDAGPVGDRLGLVLMPTTTCGAQATSQAFITNAQGNYQRVAARHMLADMVLLDAGLSVELPPLATAAGGMAALAHAACAYTLGDPNPCAELLARQAVTLLSRHLLDCVDQGDNLHARQAVVLGAHLAGQALENVPAPLLHALACPLGTLFGLPYADAVALMLPHLLRARGTPERSAALAAIVAPHVEGSVEARAEALVVATQQLAKSTGLASSLESVGAVQDDLDRLAEETLLQWDLLYAQPCPLTHAQARALYAAAL